MKGKKSETGVFHCRSLSLGYYVETSSNYEDGARWPQGGDS